MRIGVISDTHGLLRPEALQLLHGSDLILHAGDVGDPAVLGGLGEVAPVVAVRGNVDQGAWALQLPERAEVDADGHKLLMIHIRADLNVDAAAEGCAAVIFGHSHRPGAEVRDGVLYLNPGSAGPRRFSLPVTLARLRIVDGVLEHEIVRVI